MPFQLRWFFCLGATVLALQAWAEPAIFKGADVMRGQQLMTEAKCDACHAKQVGGDGSDIYNPNGKLKTAGLLRGMVELCNTQLNLGFFPEDSTDVAAALNRKHYRLKE